MSIFYQYSLTFLVAFLISWVSSPLFRLLAIYLGIVDAPDKNLKTHSHPIPYLGGASIYLGFIIAIFILRLVTHFPTGTLHSLRGIVLGSTLIFILGIVDDIKKLSFKAKFFWQTIAVFIFIIFDIRIHFITPSYLGLFFTIFWSLGVINAFNIIDIMDGLSCGIASIAALGFLFISVPTEQIYVNFTAVALAGATMAFLPYNFNPAKMFMGDAGSLFIGSIMVALSLGTSYTKINEIALFSPFLLLGVPLYDTLLVMYLRYKKSKPIFLGSPDHFALRLKKIGFSVKKIVLLSYLVTLILCLVALIITKVKFWVALSIYGLVISLFIWLSKILSKIEVK